ncbi:tetrahydrofolate dehydrogenase/cyclohydrolase catalytic domain-containing protein, partial [Actinomycetospora sp. NBRC 106375]|uniref:tetrahydrofolate dehydrogenase/cyclohydrolase catalytic domain-containing protein n=1 Tax=Actinomycetospora sp. NBRC 106375 TaxID=3032207 RepID=UPI0033339B1A
MSVYGDVVMDRLMHGIEMPTRSELIDGRVMALRLRAEVGRELAALTQVGGACGLATVMVGLDYAASAYERRLRALARRLGISYRHYWLDDGASTDEVVAVVEQLNADPGVHGILLLRPFPADIPEPVLFSVLDPHKDIEAVHPE